MQEFIVKRVQHPVGQGGFHTADMLVRDKPFRYIYDCGSLKPAALDAVLAGLSSGAREEAYDWLVISSFDMDHFNGVKKLLARQYKFKAVFLPHKLDKAFLEWLLCCYLIEERDQQEIVDALEVLRAIAAGDAGPIGPIDNVNDDDVVERVEHATDAASGVVRTVYQVKEADWIFRFYSLEQEFASAVKKLFEQAEFAELYKLIKRAAATVTGAAADTAAILEELSQVLASPPTTPPAKPAKRGKAATAVPAPPRNPSKNKVKDLLGKAYAKILPNYNAASLCLYAGPRARVDKTRSAFNVERLIGSRPWSAEPGPTRQVGWLGLGDIDFADQPSFERFAHYYLADFPLARTRMVPHHGAQSNYGKHLHMLGQFMGLSLANSLWIAAANPLSRYRHPNGAVVMACQEHGTFKMVSEDVASRIEETISIVEQPVWRLSLE